jgi:hypothetical protein
LPAPDPDPDPSLVGLAGRVREFTGHIEDMSDDERVSLLGQFAGAVGRLRARLRELYEDADEAGYMDALPPLHQLALALGEPGDWDEGVPGG